MCRKSLKLFIYSVPEIPFPDIKLNNKEFKHIYTKIIFTSLCKVTQTLLQSINICPSAGRVGQKRAISGPRATKNGFKNLNEMGKSLK